MQELLLKLVEEFRGSWRYRTIALIAAWVVCVIGWGVVLAMPNVYEASARVYLDTQGALRPLLKGLAIEPNIESELEVVRQAIMSGPKLEIVAREVGYNLSSASPRAREGILAQFKQNITVVRDASMGSTDGVYRVAFHSTDRKQSVDVVKRLLDSLVEGTLGNSRTGQEDAQKFLKSQIDDYELRLSEAEDKLANFKKENIGKMPTDNGDYFKRLQLEMTGLQESQSALSLMTARRDEIQKQLTGEEPFIFGIDNSNNAPAAAGASGDVAVRIHELEKRREDLLLRFTPKHPEVLAVESTLAELRERQDAELTRVRAGSKATGDLSSSLKTNPVYQSLQVQAKQIAVQAAELQRDVALRSGRVAELRRLVNSVPEVEAELTRLNRDYEATRAQYQELLKRLETAKLSNDVEKTGTVKFQVIEPPAVPLAPISPKRGLLLSVVLVIGVGAGLGLAFLLNLLRPVFFSWRPLGEVLGAPVIGCVRRYNYAGEKAGIFSPAMIRITAGAAGLVVVFLLTQVGSELGSSLLSHLRLGSTTP